MLNTSISGTYQAFIGGIRSLLKVHLNNVCIASCARRGPGLEGVGPPVHDRHQTHSMVALGMAIPCP
jgi:hypothetical protein